MTYKELLDKLLEFDEKTLQEPVTIYVLNETNHMIYSEFSTNVSGFFREKWSQKVANETPFLECTVMIDT